MCNFSTWFHNQQNKKKDTTNQALALRSFAVYMSLAKTVAWLKMCISKNFVARMQYPTSTMLSFVKMYPQSFKQSNKTFHRRDQEPDTVPKVMPLQPAQTYPELCFTYLGNSQANQVDEID